MSKEGDCDMAKTVKEVLEMGKNVKMVDLRFIDVPGTWQHFTIPAHRLNGELFEEGIPFDGSSIRGFQEIHESDMLLLLDPETAFLDPVAEIPTLVISCDVYDPITRQPYSRDARYVAKKAEAYLKQTGIGDTCFFGPEAEFFIFDNVRYASSTNESFYAIDSAEGWWHSGDATKPNFGGQILPKRGYFPVPPTDTLQTIRSKIVMALEECGVEMELHHHEVATAGQVELGMRFNTLTRIADQLLIYKYIAKNVARQNGKTATFMPKPVFGDNGSGMHVHQSIWKNNKNVFFDPSGYAQISDTAKYYIGGLLKHAPALLAITNPTTNSYRRLVPGYEAPVNLAYSQRNRSAVCRIPVTSSENAKRIEFRAPDSTGNPYLCFAALLMAGEPGDKDLYELPAEEAKNIKQVPGSLSEVFDALDKDHDFLLKGDVFTMDLLEAHVSYKRQNELDPVRIRPTPYEFSLYYDI